MRLCKDCGCVEFNANKPKTSICLNTKAPKRIDLITGDIVSPLCLSMRERRETDHNSCGPEGKWWETLSSKDILSEKTIDYCRNMAVEGFKSDVQKNLDKETLEKVKELAIKSTYIGFKKFYLMEKFESIPMVSDPEMMYDVFAYHFDFGEDGDKFKLIPRYRNGDKVYSYKHPGNLASFKEAIELIMKRDFDSIMTIPNCYKDEGDKK